MTRVRGEGGSEKDVIRKTLSLILRSKTAAIFQQLPPLRHCTCSQICMQTHGLRTENFRLQSEGGEDAFKAVWGRRRSGRTERNTGGSWGVVGRENCSLGKIKSGVNYQIKAAGENESSRTIPTEPRMLSQPLLPAKRETESGLLTSFTYLYEKCTLQRIKFVRLCLLWGIGMENDRIIFCDSVKLDIAHIFCHKHPDTGIL